MGACHILHRPPAGGTACQGEAPLGVRTQTTRHTPGEAGGGGQFHQPPQQRWPLKWGHKGERGYRHAKAQEFGNSEGHAQPV